MDWTNERVAGDLAYLRAVNGDINVVDRTHY